ncbi:hypothetical protein AVEN_159364-1 [Araneus ventricosus]|uniref:Uncharacterized protein n=1 Tax=Araneus ventricosus TaxID=182803 RepID=A0A4Y2A0Q3_ARAVE|nr:hypothetical protein AVEN_159364-1 [Araneus ventricosus]
MCITNNISLNKECAEPLRGTTNFCSFIQCLDVQASRTTYKSLSPERRQPGRKSPTSTQRGQPGPQPKEQRDHKSRPSMHRENSPVIDTN